jgi:hypothetical protein
VDARSGKRRLQPIAIIRIGLQSGNRDIDPGESGGSSKRKQRVNRAAVKTTQAR